MIAPLALVMLGLAAAPEVHTAIGEVHACLPTDGGGLVLATSGGLVSLDAELRVTRVRTALDGLPGTRVDALLDDGKRVWAGTEAGLVELRAGAELAVVRTWPSAPVRALARFGGALYVGTWGGGVARLDAEGHLVPIAARSGDIAAQRVTSLAVFGGALYAGTAGAGIEKLAGDALVPVTLTLPSRHVWALAEHASHLWIGTLAGLSFVDGAVVRDVRASDTRSLIEAGGELLAATYGDGLVALDAAGRARGASASDQADTLFFDYVGARGDAVCAVAPGVVRVRSAPDAAWREAALGGLPSNDVAAIVADGARLWVGLFDRGLASIEAGQVQLSDSEIDPQVNALAIERRGGRSVLWIATARGLYADDGSGARRFGTDEGLPDEEIHAIAPLASGGVLVGTGRGAVVLRDGRGAELIGRKQGLPGQAVWAVAEDRAGRMLLGTSAGLIAWYGDGRWERFSVASGHLDDDWVTALAVSGGAVWVGTYAGGVSRLEAAGDRLVATQLGGGHVNLGGLAIVGGTAYAATMEGLRVRGASDGDWRLFAATLGVDVTGVAPAQGGGVWIATRRGITRSLP